MNKKQKTILKYVISIISFILILLFFILIFNIITKQQLDDNESKTKLESLDDLMIDYEDVGYKQEVYDDLNKLFKEAENKTDIKTLENLASNNIKVEDLYQKDILYFFDGFDSQYQKSLSYQAFLSVAYIIKEKPTDWQNKDITVEKSVTAISIDKKRGYASVPLYLFSENLAGLNMDVFYYDGEWKPMMLNLITHIQTLDYMNTKLEGTE